MDIPYDRPRTTMRSSEMCAECQAEYDNPLDRRFHAQPNACPNCGPALELIDARVNQVTLSGGVFQNRLLLRTVIPLLENGGLSVLTHKQVPATDGGVSLGQAAIASFVVDTLDQASYNLS